MSKKSDTRPDYHRIEVEMTDGERFTTYSTWGQEGDLLKLEIDPKTHPAWTGKHRIVDSEGRLARFNRRYQNISKSAAEEK